jgi:hypothetical protein
MADHADITGERVELTNTVAVAAVRAAAAKMPKGEEGECPLCGEHSLRIVRGACPPCRDKHKLP